MASGIVEHDTLIYKAHGHDEAQKAEVPPI